MIDLNKRDLCVGCTACSLACPRGAITMKRSEEGFLYPEIRTDLCSSCGLCEGVCPIDEKTPDTDTPKAYYGWHSDDAVRYRSSSGGFFSALADEVILQGGTVYGAIFNGKDFVYSSTDAVALDALRKSKYTEIDPSDVFSKVKEDLSSGKKVLFCGTPCRVAGLRTYLGKDDENLILVDFLCGGVASPKFLKEDFQYWEKRSHSPVSGVDFRCKKSGWGGQYLMRIEFKNGRSKTILAKEDAYFTGFLSRLINRKSCYSCQYVDNHFADITMGDFWEYRKVPGLSNDKKGMSMMVAQTEKGRAAIEEIKNFNLHELDYNLVKGNFSRTGNYHKNLEKRDDFVKSALEKGFIPASKKYMKRLTIFKYKVRYYLKKLRGE